MCIIINKPPLAKMTEEEFALAVTNNPHGYGLTVADEYDGQLITVRSAEEPDPEKLYRVMFEEFDNMTAMLHLRWNTAGETIMRNAHPFPVLEYETDGVDLRMAHNGTIHKYKPGYSATNKWESDTRVFVREFVRPLFKRLIRGMESIEILTDPFISKMLEDILPNSSVLSFLDGFGNDIQFNALGNGGEYRDDGLYLSNTYSLKKGHRTSKHSTVTHFPKGRGGTTANSQTKSKSGTTNTIIGQSKTGFSKDYAPMSIYRDGEHGYGYYLITSELTGKALPKEKEFKHTEIVQSTMTENFSDKYDLRTAHEVFLLSDATLQRLADEHPDDLVLLVKEMMFRQQSLMTAKISEKEDYEKRLKTQAETIKELRNVS